MIGADHDGTSDATNVPLGNLNDRRTVLILKNSETPPPLGGRLLRLDSDSVEVRHDLKDPALTHRAAAIDRKNLFAGKRGDGGLEGAGLQPIPVVGGVKNAENIYLPVVQ